MSAKTYKTLAGLEAEVRRRLSWSSTVYFLTNEERGEIYMRCVYKTNIFPWPLLESLFYPKLNHEIDVDTFYNDNFERELRLTIRLKPFEV
jgi:hypothetical protein